MRRTISVIMAATLVLAAVPMQGYAEEIISEDYVEAGTVSEIAGDSAVVGGLTESVDEKADETELTQPELSEELSEEQPELFEPVPEQPQTEEIKPNAEIETEPLPDGLDADVSVDDVEIISMEETGIMPVDAAGSEEDNYFQYTVLADGTAEITGYDGAAEGDLNIPDKVDGYTVTSIGWYAFSDSDFSGSLTLPESLTSIGPGAFSGCSGFTEGLKLPENLTSIGYNAFFGCSGFMGGLKLPESLTSIGSGAFSGCSGFTGGLKFPESLTSIGYSAFSDCSGFTGELKLPENLTSIDDYIFSGCGFTGELTLPVGLISIGCCTFSDCDFTGELTLPDGLKEIGAFAFDNCNFTGSLKLPKDWTAIGDDAFSGCAFSGELILPEKLTSIGNGAFYGCGFTGDLTLPTGLISIGSSAFSESTFTGELSLPESLKSIGEYAFAGNWDTQVCFAGDLKLPDSLESVGTNAFNYCSFAGGLKLPKDWTEIKDNAFSGCLFGGELFLPEKLTSIGNSAFYGCGFKGGLLLPEGLVSIGDSAFYRCGFTGGLTLPEGLTSIGNSAFSSCGFTGELILPEGLESIGDEAFYRCGFTGKLILPESLKSVGEGAFAGDWDAQVCFAGDLKLPDSLESVGPYAFNHCSFAGSLKLPKDWTEIGDNAFSNCLFGGELFLPEKLTSIGNRAFSGCGFTGELTLPAGMISIGDYAFYDCAFTGEIVLPEGLKSIGESVFLGNHFTGKLSVPEGVTELGEAAFFNYIDIGQSAITECFIGENTVLDACACNNYNDNRMKIDAKSPYPLLTWSSSDESVAQVDAYGKVTAIGAGKTVINAVSYDGKEASVAIRVLAKESSGYDSLAPAVTGVRFQESVVKPGIVTISMDVIEENTGITSCYGYFYNISDSGRSIGFDFSNSQMPMFSGTYTCKMSVPSSARADEYYLYSIYLRDQAGNESSYYYNGDGRWRHYSVGSEGYYANINVNDGRNRLVVENEYEIAFQSSVANASVTSKLESMSDGSAAMLNFDSNNHIAKKEWFEAIKGTDKTLILSNDGIQWVFHGKDITETKDIDCAVTVETTYIFWDESEKDLRIIFASNGVLPGKATVRIKSDYISYMYNLSNTLYLYFLKEDGTLLLEDMPEYILDGSDHWCEFELTHNSTFVVSGKELSESEQVRPGSEPGGQPAPSPSPSPSPSPQVGTGTTTSGTANVSAETIKVGKAAIKSLKSSKKGKAALQIKKISDVSGYEVIYSTNKKFRKNVKTKTTKKPSMTLKKLKRNKIYYVKVRAYKINRAGAKVYGKYSKVKKVKIK